MHVDDYVGVTMPLCRSSRGVPIVLFPISRPELLLEWAWHERVIVESALDDLERLRHEHHGDASQLPTLDPSAWCLVPAGEGFHLVLTENPEPVRSALAAVLPPVYTPGR